MGKSSPPPPPTPPSAAEISAANTDSARAMMKLQRAMQFGEEMMKDGYLRQKTDIPEGGKPVHTYQDVRTYGPKEIQIPTVDGGHNLTVKADGTVDVGKLPNRYTYNETHKDKILNEYYESLDGKHWHDFLEGNSPKGKELKAQHGAWLNYKITNNKKIGKQSISNKIKSITGWETPDGKIHTANIYYKIADDGTKTEVTREEALDTDFTGMGDTDLAQKQWEFEKETSPERTQFLLDQMKQFGPEFMEQARDLVERSDPTGFAARELLGKLAQEYQPADVPEGPAMEQFGEVAAAERLAAPPTLGEVAYTPEYEKAGELGGLSRLGGTPTYLESELGGPAYERAGEQEALRRVGEAPQFAELDTYGPDLEQASAMNALQRLGEFGGMERAGELGGLERAGEMDALTRLGATPTLRELDGGPSLERAAAMDQLERSQAAPSLERLEDIPEITVDPTSLAGRRYAEQQFIDRAQEGRTSQLMADEARRVARGRAAAAGNIFGGGAVIEESRAVRQAEDAGQRQALSDLIGFLSSGQTAGDYESRLAQQNLANRLTGIQQRTGATQAEFGMGQQVLGQRNVAALQERADALAALGQRNQAEQAEYDNLTREISQINQARQAGYGMEGARVGSERSAELAERADQLGALSQRNVAEEREYQAALQSLQQRNLAGTTEYGFEAQQLAQQNQAALQERADQLAALGQRNTAQQQEFQNLQSSLAQINQVREAQLGADVQAAGFDNAAQMQERADELAAIGQRNQAQEAEFNNLQTTLAQVNQTRQQQFTTGVQQQEFDTQQQLRERADQLGAMAQRNQAEESEFQSLLQGLQQQQNARTAGFGMQAQAVGQRNQAQEADFAREQSAIAQRNQARQQSFANAMQRTATQQQMQQQQMANLQSFSGLAPVSTQFGGLSGAQAQAGANFNPIQYQPTSAQTLLQGQQQLQGNIFGTQANIWGQQAQAAAQPSGFGQILGTVGGAFAGGYGEGLGSSFFKKNNPSGE